MTQGSLSPISFIFTSCVKPQKLYVFDSSLGIFRLTFPFFPGTIHCSQFHLRPSEVDSNNCQPEENCLPTVLVNCMSAMPLRICAWKILELSCKLWMVHNCSGTFFFIIMPTSSANSACYDLLSKWNVSIQTDCSWKWTNIKHVAHENGQT